MSQRFTRHLLLMGVPLVAAILGTTHVGSRQPTALQSLGASPLLELRSPEVARRATFAAA